MIAFFTTSRSKQSMFLLLIALFLHSNVLECLDLSLRQSDENKNTNDDNYSFCTDIDRDCKQWALIGECRKEASYKYMQANCAESCNLCNPHYEKWSPQNKGILKTDHHFLTQKYDKLPIFHGVKQNTDFSKSSFTKDKKIQMTGGKSMTAAEYYKLRTIDVIEAMRSYLDLIFEDEENLVDEEGYLADDETPNTSIRALRSSPVDIEYAPYNSRVLATETCVNRHPNCALWTVLGYCESNADLMSDMCSSMCQICDTVWKSKEATQFEKASWIISPNHRDDLHGVFENIYNNNVIVNNDNTPFVKEQLPPNMKIENRKGKPSDVQYLNLDDINIETIIAKRSRREQKNYRSYLMSNGTAPVFSTILSMQNFLTPEECSGLLDTVKFGVGVDTRNIHGDTDQDGFPSKSIDIAVGPDGDESAVRSSSRVSLFPSIKDKAGIMRYSNAIERLLVKISLLTGMNAAERIESPILFERFQEEDVHAPSSHFKSAVSDSDVYHFSSDNFKVKFGEQYYFRTFPDKMENPRVLGMVIFLNGGVKEEDGGSMYFPNIPGVEIFPRAGTAVLFPTVASLVRMEMRRDYQYNTLDEKYDFYDGDQGYFVEEMQTFFGHKKLKKGTVYCMKLYFRRNIESNRHE